jgi:hypothetical protein
MNAQQQLKTPIPFGSALTTSATRVICCSNIKLSHPLGIYNELVVGICCSNKALGKSI